MAILRETIRPTIDLLFIQQKDFPLELINVMSSQKHHVRWSVSMFQIFQFDSHDSFIYTVSTNLVLYITHLRYSLLISYMLHHMMSHSDDRSDWPRAESYLAQDAANVLPTDHEPRVIKVVHNLVKSLWNLFVLLQIAAAKLGIIFAEAQRLLRMERWLVVQALRVGICMQEAQKEPKQKVEKLSTPKSY